jgi:hypothetical protein
MVERHVHSLGTESPAIFVYIKILAITPWARKCGVNRTLAR